MVEKKLFQGPEREERSLQIGKILDMVMDWPEEDLNFLINDLIEILEK
jgi:hypothetical protein